MFILHPQLEKDCFFVCDLALSRVLLMNNSNFIWLILVPRVENMRELIDLIPSDQHVLLNEIAHVSHIMKTLFTPEKLNIAALGNQVAQLHIHVIARYTNDKAWPNPVWGLAASPYPSTPSDITQQLRTLLSSSTGTPSA